MKISIDQSFDRISKAHYQSYVQIVHMRYMLYSICTMQALCKCMLFAYADIKLLEVVNMPIPELVIGRTKLADAALEY